MFKMSIEQQFSLFLYLCILGLITGFVFDFYKAWSKAFHFSRRAIFLVDLCFCLFLALALFCLLLHANRGEVRLYTFMALLIGILSYFNFISPYLYPKYIALSQNIKSFKKRIMKRVRFWQESVNKKRTLYRERGYCARLKRMFRKED